MDNLKVKVTVHSPNIQKFEECARDALKAISLEACNYIEGQDNKQFSMVPKKVQFLGTSGKAAS